LASLGELVGVVTQFYIDLCNSTAQGAALEKVCADLLGKYGLLPDQIAKRYLVSFRRRILFGLTSQLVELPPLNVSIQLLVPARPETP